MNARWRGGLAVAVAAVVAVVACDDTAKKKAPVDAGPQDSGTGSGGTAGTGGAGGAAGTAGASGAAGAAGAGNAAGAGGSSGSGGVAGSGGAGGLDASAGAAGADAGGDAAAGCAPDGGATWSTPELVSSGTEGVWRMRTAVDPQGNAMLLWWLDATGDILARPWSATGTWGSPQPVETAPEATRIEDGELVAEGNGAFTAAWVQVGDATAPGQNVWLNRWSSTPGWGAPALVDGLDTNAIDVDLAAGPAGAVVAWAQDTGYGETGVYARAGAAAATLVQADPVGVTFPKVATNASGQAVVVWTRYGTRRSVWAARYAGGSWGVPELLDNGTDEADVPQVAMNDAGQIVVAWWNAPPGGGVHLVARVYEPSGGWGAPATLDTSFWERHDVAIDPAGNAIVAFVRNSTPENAYYAIYANRYQPGAGWSGPVRLVAPDTEAGNAYDPSVGMDATGNAVVAWYQGDASAGRGSVWVNRYHAGCGWGAPQQVDGADIDAQHTRVAVNAAGQAVVGFQRFDASLGIWNLWATALR